MQSQLAIIIPAYKETFLRETLESIAAQTDKRFTLYIGDDCSPHDLKSIIDDFQDKINIVYHRFDSNLGGKDLVAHWERCIALSKDEKYIWLFSDDDIMEPRCVESFYNIPEETRNSHLIHFNIKVIDDLDGGRIKPATKFPHLLKAGQFLENKLRGRIISFVVEFIFTRQLYNETGGFQNFDLAWGSDFMTWLKMAAACENGIYTVSDGEENCVLWRRSDQNISPQKSRPIVIRKINALIEDAVFIKGMFKNDPSDLEPLGENIRWFRFPLGEIVRNKRILTQEDTAELLRTYRKKVGYPILTFLLRQYLRIKD